MGRAQDELRGLERPQPVKLDLDARRLMIGQFAAKLSPAQARLYAAFARIKTEQCVEPARKNCDGCAACYRPLSKENWDSARQELETLAGDRFLRSDIAYFRSLLSKTNSAVTKGLGSERLAERYQIRSDGPRGETRYGLAVDKNLIHIEP